MRNAVQRRNHKERSQPEERKRFGLLEKHKDYSARAKDYGEKKKKLRQLREKALERNPDEFYYGMVHKKGPSAIGKNSTGTVNGSRGNAVLSQDASRLFKTQDMGYIRTMRNKTLKEVAELEKRIVGITGDGTRIVFVDSEEEQRKIPEGEDVDMDDEEEDSRGEEEEVEKIDTDTKNQRRLHQREINKLETRLRAAKQRLKALADAEEALDLQRAKMAKSPTVGGINKNGVKFKIRERKR
ncbi:U3 small nucleolar RNA-associated protein-like protein Utp11 [Xylogone sp. PMI_703]|nr:U3 small nucleolar RNA-associated protein-like protein Utp11 [Xylogone sp. PMI_703]